MVSSDGSMTLAFGLAALERFTSPQAVIQDAREWTEYVGIISDRPTFAVTKFAREHNIRQDFFSGPRGRAESLEQVREQFKSDRYVYIGVSEEEAAVAEEAGWEYLSVEETAEAAEWDLPS